jgi:hypothetical protein
MGARWYSPVTCRFLSPDPVAGELEKPLTQNPYPYCACDPVNFNDLTGKFHDPNGGLIDDSDAAEPTLSWDVGSTPEGMTTGEYWDSMAGPIKEIRAAARARANESNKLHIVQQSLEGIIADREKWIEAGLGSIYEVFGDNTALVEIYWGLLALPESGRRGLIDIVEAIDNYCEEFLNQTTGINNLENLMNKYMNYAYASSPGVIERIESAIKQSEGLGKIFAFLSELSEPITMVILEATGNGLEDTFRRLEECSSLELLVSRVGKLNYKGEYERGSLIAPILLDYAEAQLEGLGFSIERGGNFYPAGGQNWKFTYAFTEMAYNPNPLTLDTSHAPPIYFRKYAGGFYSMEEWRAKIDAIKTDMRYKEDAWGTGYVMP